MSLSSRQLEAFGAIRTVGRPRQRGVAPLCRVVIAALLAVTVATALLSVSAATVLLAVIVIVDRRLGLCLRLLAAEDSQPRFRVFGLTLLQRFLAGLGLLENNGK